MSWARPTRGEKLWRAFNRWSSTARDYVGVYTSRRKRAYCALQAALHSTEGEAILLDETIDRATRTDRLFDLADRIYLEANQDDWE